ncbi:uncharacterized protein CXQ87_004062 [Candidozyma duobushaemuli]|uniref:Arrestin C-terminal-like domain-containing protein n=2 Tax=Candidozyma TaxID=3303203 RepID=A0ABX8I789_9ASCO|nr:uncharacterized protein CXQ87_004062 [[Candida] duobushaemulonis]PVH16194.1 hypothetical protein CXQ87_004062 [[Candida] duobushaemulonis]QWU89136.1 hypothetical protein CA3LBN_003459 [[Candida] haemuloni]
MLPLKCFRGDIHLSKVAREYNPGDTVDGMFRLTANRPFYLKHIYAGYTCKSTTSLLKQDQKLFLSGVQPKSIQGDEDHYLLNYENEVLTLPHEVKDKEKVEVPFRIKLPRLSQKYGACDTHTYPRRDGLFDHVPEHQRILPPRAKFKVSQNTIIDVSHHIKVEVCAVVNGKEEWDEVIQPMPFEPLPDQVPRNWDHLTKDEELLPDIQEKTMIAKIQASFGTGPREMETKLAIQFLDPGLINGPLGPSRRGLICDHPLPDFIKITVELPIEAFKSKFHARPIHIMGTRVVSMREATIIGGIHGKTDNPGEYCYKKHRKVYCSSAIVGQRGCKEKVQPEIIDNKAVFEIPKHLFGFRIPRTGESLKACNFTVDSILTVSIQLLIGHNTKIELSEQLPIMVLVPPSERAKTFLAGRNGHPQSTHQYSTFLAGRQPKPIPVKKAPVKVPVKREASKKGLVSTLLLKAFPRLASGPQVAKTENQDGETNEDAEPKEEDEPKDDSESKGEDSGEASTEEAVPEETSDCSPHPKETSVLKDNPKNETSPKEESSPKVSNLENSASKNAENPTEKTPPTLKSTGLRKKGFPWWYSPSKEASPSENNADSREAPLTKDTAIERSSSLANMLKFFEKLNQSKDDQSKNSTNGESTSESSRPESPKPESPKPESSKPSKSSSDETLVQDEVTENPPSENTPSSATLGRKTMECSPGSSSESDHTKYTDCAEQF